jgi:hypothetical protein
MVPGVLMAQRPGLRLGRGTAAGHGLATLPLPALEIATKPGYLRSTLAES